MHTLFKSTVNPPWARMLFLLAGLFCPALLHAQSPSGTLSVEQFMSSISENGFKFNAYETENSWSGSNHPPILDTPFKRNFKTILTEAAKIEPNFDGKYVLVSWGCGTECQHFAIIDVETGIVTDGLTTRWGQNFRADSSLVIVNDPNLFFAESGSGGDWLPEMFHTEYYRWDGEQLILLKTLER